MELFGDNFLKLRNDHVIPMINYGIKRNKCCYWSLKETLTTKLISLRKLSGNSIEIEITEEDYYKAVHCEVEMFLNKSFIQLADFQDLTKISSTWTFVTFYYFTFFSTVCLFRFLNKGFIYFSNEQIKRLINFSLAVHSNPILLSSGNYYYSVKEKNAYGNIIIILTSKSENVHKSNWIQLESTIRAFRINSDIEEQAIFDVFLHHFHFFKVEYPSSLRNQLNYTGISSFLDLGDNLKKPLLHKIDKDFFKNLLVFDETGDKIFCQIMCISYLSSYIFRLNQMLYEEYTKRSGYGADFQHERISYLKKRSVVV